MAVNDIISTYMLLITMRNLVVIDDFQCDFRVTLLAVYLLAYVADRTARLKCLVTLSTYIAHSKGPHTEDLSKIESLGEGEGQKFLLERDDKSEKEGSM